VSASRVFLSYSSKSDSQFATILAQQLRSVGFDIFLDVESILPGENIEARIEQEIAASERVIFVVSADSRDGRWTRYEEALAAKSGRLTIPVLRFREGERPLGPVLNGVRYVGWLPEHDLDIARRESHLWEIYCGLKKLELGEVKDWARSWRSLEKVRSCALAVQRIDELRIVHLSDLHFHEQTPDKVLLALEKAVTAIQPDAVIVSGDLSDHSNRLAMFRARDWLTLGTKIALGGGLKSGLALGENAIIVVPGNHDLRETPLTGRKEDRHHASLLHFGDAFGTDTYPRYHWISNGKLGVFLAALDTSFLVDGEEAGARLAPAPVNGVRRRHLSRKDGEVLLLRQTRLLAQEYERGIRGQLEYGGAKIGAAAFARSVKAVLMHHLIIEPYGNTDIDIGQKQRKQAVRDIFAANYDVLLAGHHHHIEDDGLPYRRVFKKRGPNKSLLATYCRTIGILGGSLSDKDGSPQDVRLSILMRKLVLVSLLKDVPQNELIEAIESALKKPTQLKSILHDMLDATGAATSKVPDAGQVESVARIAISHFNVAERIELRSKAYPIVSEALGEFARRRNLVHSMAGSALVHRDDDHPRAFKSYRVSAGESDTTEFTVEEFGYSEATGFSKVGHPRTTYPIVSSRQQTFQYDLA
jgi:predicted phosphodiesterase